MSGNRLLLHVCCAPDGTVPLADLGDEGYDVTAYWYGGNIHPEGEEKKRRDSLALLTSRLGVPFLSAPYDPDPWMAEAGFLGGEPEGGSRCALCFRIQLEAAARAAFLGEIPWMCTTLTMSPHKDPSLINAIGERAASLFGRKWLFRIFRKKNGFLRSIGLSREFGLYRQSYCGCLYSMHRGDGHERTGGGETPSFPS